VWERKTPFANLLLKLFGLRPLHVTFDWRNKEFEVELLASFQVIYGPLPTHKMERKKILFLCVLECYTHCLLGANNCTFSTVLPHSPAKIDNRSFLLELTPNIISIKRRREERKQQRN